MHRMAVDRIATNLVQEWTHDPQTVEAKIELLQRSKNSKDKEVLAAFEKAINEIPLKGEGGSSNFELSDPVKKKGIQCQTKR